MAKRVEESYGVRKLESRLRATSEKRIIDEWRNSNDRYDGILRNDEFYEERAIDVGDADANLPSATSRKNESSSHSSARELSTIAAGKRDSRADNSSRSAKTERNTSSGTVRSIPIKDYRASLVQNVGTLRKSVVPQQQFESLVSEPERNFRVPPKRRSRLNVAQQQEKPIKFPGQTKDNRNGAADEFSRRTKSRRSDKSARERFNDRTIEFLPSFRFLDEPSDLFVDSGVFSRGASTCRERSTPVEAAQTPRKSQNNGEPGDNDDDCGEEEQRRKNAAVDLERGNVCKKISVYEENVRLGSGRSGKIAREALTASKRRRTIGVPLVGMHNACGLPVIAHWPENRVFGTLRVPGRIVGTLRTSERRNGKSSLPRAKRRAPQPSEIPNSRKSRESPVANGGDEILGTARLEESPGSAGRRKILKRPSFKAGRNAIPYRNRYCRRNAGKMGMSQERGDATNGTLGRHDATRRSAKRSTLYARDEGNEVAQVLTSLCLNPLARKGAANMIW